MMNKELKIDGQIAERRGAECAEGGDMRKDGKAMAMVGWGHGRRSG